MNNLNTTASYLTDITFRSIHSEFKKSLTCFVVKEITDLVPNEPVPRNRLNIPKQLKLADPHFEKPASVDMLIGSGPTLSILCPGQLKILNNDNLILQKTKLGWILGGNLESTNLSKSSRCLVTSLPFDLERFWRLEEKLDEERTLSKDELYCEEHFITHVKRSKDGRYIVALPFDKTKGKLGNSKQTALKQLLYLRKRFQRDHEYKREYTKVIEEYLKLGHMTLVETIGGDGFYLPHHGVPKLDSLTTMLRVVFNASVTPSDGGCSLNDCLLVGPTIQDDLITLLLRFRTHTYVILADIEKMYRQFLVRDSDRKYQKILWFVNDEIREFVLNTVTFGVAAAPFLAIRCLHQLADDEQERFPLAAKILKRDMYVDNMLTGTNSVEEARSICTQMTQVLRTAGMNMRQWAANDPNILSDIESKNLDANFDLSNDNTLKTLGIRWRAKTDSYVYKIKPISVTERFTKRKILSEIAKIFDPLGLLGPIILFAKKIMQDIWKAKIDWDETVPNDIYYQWNEFCLQLSCLPDMSFNRHILTNDANEIQIHGFSDASETGYGACIYMRSKDTFGNYKITLICSKSRVAPVKTRSLPRLELCGAQLLANLYVHTIRSIRIQVDRTYFWCDSSITLHWINTAPPTLKTFVANRVVDIQLKTEIHAWRHIRSEDNPADALSKGQLPNDFLNNEIWLHGPPWLQQNETEWPESHIIGLTEIPEIKKAHCFVTKSDSYCAHLLKIIENQTSLMKLKRIFALCLRLPKKYRTNTKIRDMRIKDLQKAENAVIRLVQGSVFANDIAPLKANKPLNEKSSLASLDPFIDEENILRVGGRIRKAIAPFSKRHPILLSKNNFFTDLIIQHYHTAHFHTGIQNTLYAIRENYWPIDGRNQIRKNIRKCTICFRANPQLCQYKMGDLPQVRVTQSRPFYNVGVDYCGPFFIKEKRYRNQKFIKIYVAIFVCMTVKAIHIEVVEDLSTEGFIAALRRFISRRGLPGTIYSDNGTNFRGAHNKLNELYELLNSQQLKINLEKFTNSNKIEWHFIPPHSPNFGGLWEISVKQFKHHFKRVAADKRFTLAEFNTFSIEIEAILNSRPITRISSDINDLSAITPGHFLIGDSLKGLPEQNYTKIPDNRLSAWEIMSKLKQQFWERWNKEYLNELNIRHNKSAAEPKLTKDLVVLIKEDNTPPMQWNMGIITDVHPGADKIIRVVTVRTKHGLKKRPTSKIAVLPIDDNLEKQETISKLKMM
ncbi:uncharacterized protein LOC103317564 [Nasonia vitripennis]|uniref:Integrase catalytic domain-containing protein n=1 Tax=Nasonia vitripennis TaxID=7425 RepID=A0A7M7LV28_NASVI|nr:uncharacterized protein LOC103317564 [Nasonia vitripennis]